MAALQCEQIVFTVDPQFSLRWTIAPSGGGQPRWDQVLVAVQPHPAGKAIDIRPTSHKKRVVLLGIQRLSSALKRILAIRFLYLWPLRSPAAQHGVEKGKRRLLFLGWTRGRAVSGIAKFLQVVLDLAAVRLLVHGMLFPGWCPRL
jgi:hypothetical protein